MKVLSVVCARAGSKGLKNKCICKINNKMVVEYSIEYSISLGNDVKTVVSTNIEELIEYCEIKGIKYIKRNQNICTDESRIEEALADTIQQQGNNCKYCSLVYGNIPIRYPSLFHKGLAFLEKEEEFDAVISMQNVEKFHPDWMFDFNEDRLPKTKEVHYNRQSLSQKMIPDGHTFIFKKKNFIERFNGLIPYEREYKYAVFGEKIKPLITNTLIIDIDTERDINLAEAIISNCKE